MPCAKVPAEGDGNCFFHAVASELIRTKIDINANYQTLRANAAQYLDDHPALFEHIMFEVRHESALPLVAESATGKARPSAFRT